MPLSISFALSMVDQQFFTSRVPQQNGVVERKNCTLVEMARTMLDEHKTPICFWADAISTACYISNRISCARSRICPPLSFTLDASHPSVISGLLVASALY
jgi:hypothetical protein